MQGKSAVITGAGSGIGAGIAKAFAADGYAITAADINLEAAQETCASILAETPEARVQAVKANVSKEAEVSALIKQTVSFAGQLDSIVNAAGIWRGGTVLTISEADWDAVMEVNTKGLFWLARLGHEHLCKTRGSITTISSIAGMKGTRRAGAYNPSKAAVIAFTKNLALDFADDGIRANCICPGFIGTPMGDQVLDFRGGGDVLLEATTRLHPLGRIGTPDDIAQAALYLASPGASWTTGSALVVDGGCMCGY